jgi:hypothetical protein
MFILLIFKYKKFYFIFTKLKIGLKLIILFLAAF